MVSLLRMHAMGPPTAGLKWGLGRCSAEQLPGGRPLLRLSSLINVRGYKKTGGYLQPPGLSQPGRAGGREKEGCFEKVAALPTAGHWQHSYHDIVDAHDDYIHRYMHT